MKKRKAMLGDLYQVIEKACIKVKNARVINLLVVTLLVTQVLIRNLEASAPAVDQSVGLQETIHNSLPTNGYYLFNNPKSENTEDECAFASSLLKKWQKASVQENASLKTEDEDEEAEMMVSSQHFVMEVEDEGDSGKQVSKQSKYEKDWKVRKANKRAALKRGKKISRDRSEKRKTAIVVSNAHRKGLVKPDSSTKKGKIRPSSAQMRKKAAIEEKDLLLQLLKERANDLLEQGRALSKRKAPSTTSSSKLEETVEETEKERVTKSSNKRRTVRPISVLRRKKRMQHNEMMIQKLVKAKKTRETHDRIDEEHLPCSAEVFIEQGIKSFMETNPADSKQIKEKPSAHLKGSIISVDKDIPDPPGIRMGTQEKGDMETMKMVAKEKESISKDLFKHGEIPKGNYSVSNEQYDAEKPSTMTQEKKDKSEEESSSFFSFDKIPIFNEIIQKKPDEKASRVVFEDSRAPKEAPAMGEVNKELEPYPLAVKKDDKGSMGYTVNFENISIIELIQFVSKIAGTNFVYDNEDLDFNVSIVSQEQSSVADLSAILLQVLKMHDLQVIEQGNSVLIYKNEGISRLSTVVTDSNLQSTNGSTVITRVFKLYTLLPSVALEIIKPLLSKDAILSASEKTSHLVISDITTNVNRAGDLLDALDTASSDVEMMEYRVKYANVHAISGYLHDLLGSFAKDTIFKITVQPGTNRIFLVSSPSLLNKALKLAESLDVPEISGIMDAPDEDEKKMEASKFAIYKLKYQRGDSMAKSLQDIGDSLASDKNKEKENDFIQTVKAVRWLESNNSLIITGSRKSTEKVVQLLETLDQPPKQVYIEVLILDTSLESSCDFGVQWIALGDDQNKVAYGSGLLNTNNGVNPVSGMVSGATPTNSTPPSASKLKMPTPDLLSGIPDLVAGSTSFGLGILGNVISHGGKSFLSLGALLSALDQDGDTVIVLNPRIMAQDSQEAKFFVGQTIPYQTQTSASTTSGGAATLGQNIEYKDIGVDLRVSSTVAPNNVVTLQIEQTISEIQTAVGLLTPSTNKTFASTRLQVPDGCFLVMSGHIRDKVVKMRSGIPILGSIPFIGNFFSRTIDQRQKRNIMMFIRPKVLNGTKESVQFTNKEGYKYNWDANKASLDYGPRIAPEYQPLPEGIDEVRNNSLFVTGDSFKETANKEEEKEGMKVKTMHP